MFGQKIIEKLSIENMVSMSSVYYFAGIKTSRDFSIDTAIKLKMEEGHYNLCLAFAQPVIILILMRKAWTTTMT